MLSLRQLGFPLDEIRSCLQRPDYSPIEVLGRHVARIREQIEAHRNLCERLEALAAVFRAAGEVSAEEFLQTIEVMNMVESYYKPEQLETLRQRREQSGAAGEERIRQGQAEWAALWAEYHNEMVNGTDPSDPKLQALETRRRALVGEFTGGDPGIEQSLTRLWTEQGDRLSAQMGYEPSLLEFMSQVRAAAKGSV